MHWIDGINTNLDMLHKNWISHSLSRGKNVFLTMRAPPVALVSDENLQVLDNFHLIALTAPSHKVYFRFLFHYSFSCGQKVSELVKERCKPLKKNSYFNTENQVVAVLSPMFVCSNSIALKLK
jgi:hypothetical protein